MPKVCKTPTSSTQHRHVPYPSPASTTAPSTMTAQASTSPTPGTDRHASHSWPAHNDELLIHARQQGLNWQPIASTYFPGKTANACRKRHERLMEKRNSADVWGVKMEALAKAYVDVREQMWKLLADRVGEKWQTVEAKVCIQSLRNIFYGILTLRQCMEKGLKNLTAAGRTASRREVANLGTSPYDDNMNIHPTSERKRSLGHSDEADSFPDNAMVHDLDHPFRTGPQDEHQQTPFSAGGLSSSTPSGRSFSTSSSTFITPTVSSAAQFSPHQRKLPSFSSTFGAPIHSVIHNLPPVTTH